MLEFFVCYAHFTTPLQPTKERYFTSIYYGYSSSASNFCKVLLDLNNVNKGYSTQKYCPGCLKVRQFLRKLMQMVIYDNRTMYNYKKLKGCWRICFYNTEENWGKPKWKPINCLQWNSNRKRFLFRVPDNSL